MLAFYRLEHVLTFSKASKIYTEVNPSGKVKAKIQGDTAFLSSIYHV